MKILQLVLTVLCACILAGCGHSEQAKAEKAINAGLIQHANCIDTPADVYVDPLNPGQKAVLDALQAKGLVASGTVTAENLFGKKFPKPGYVLTPAAQALVGRAAVQGTFAVMPCLRSGHYQVAKIAAIDNGNDIDGQPMASVRTTLHFVPEAWFADTKANPQFTNLWTQIDATEKAQWVYRLRKSGDDLFFGGLGERLN